jgi:hypothetical protein
MSDKLKAVFDEFRQDPANRFIIRVRRYRATRLREMLTEQKDSISLDTFNHDVWAIESETIWTGKALSNLRIAGDNPIDPHQIPELETALDAGRLELHGNYIWGSGSQVYGSRLAGSTIEQKEQYLHQALNILDDLGLEPIAKARQIDDIPGFGPNISTGLVMVFYPDQFALFNTPSSGALRQLGYPVDTPENFEKSAAKVKSLLDAQDFIEMDWFLYLLFNGKISLGPAIWWVIQGGYEYERDNRFLWAPKRSPKGRILSYHQDLARLRPDDLILHYSTSSSSLRAVGRVTASAQDAPYPTNRALQPWEEDGYLAKVDYSELQAPIQLQSIPGEWRTQELGPFNRTGNVNQGYLFPLSTAFYDELVGRWPFLERRNTWLFQANPRFYDITTRLKIAEIGQEDQWTVSRYRDDMRPGDRLVIWQAGHEAGVYALGELSGQPFQRGRSDWRRSDSDGSETEWAVRFRYTQILSKPLLKSDLLHNPALANLAVIRSPQGTNFQVTPEEYAALQSLIVPGDHQVCEHDAEYVPYLAPSFEEICQSILGQGLRMDERQLRRYHLSLNSRKFVILSGVSGTGKSWLTEAYAKAINAEYLLVPVAPNWTTNEDLLGYMNPLRDDQYCDTDFSLFLRATAKEYEEAISTNVNPRPYHLVLDEMNLARVEYYFAKFLSAMEVRARDGIGRIELEPGNSVILPPNLYFIGTVNVDETTHGFADKVYDRAQLIELEASRDNISNHLGPVPYRDDLMQVWDAVHEVAPFAYRVVGEVKAYITQAEPLGVSWQDALDEQLLQKVLPKLKGADSRVGKALEDFQQVTANRFTLSNTKASRMLEGFNQHGFASYF